MGQKGNVIGTLFKMDRLVFTTREWAAMSRSSLASSSQCLQRLEKKGILKKIVRGVWANIADQEFTPHLLIACLTGRHRAYLSFISALHIHGVISQIPQVITVASTNHSRCMRTPVGTFDIHQIAPSFFDGFDFYGKSGYLIATKEKALVDCLYIASRKGNAFGHFPEMDIGLMNKKETFAWAKMIKNPSIRTYVLEKLNKLFAIT